MLYRQKHTETREIKSKMNFLMNYYNAQNAATGSKFDANVIEKHCRLMGGRHKLT